MGGMVLNAYRIIYGEVEGGESRSGAEVGMKTRELVD